MSDFDNDLIDGKRVERMVGDIFASKGHEVIYPPDGYFPDWDLQVDGMPCEVKHDRQAHHTGNVFFEKRYRGEPSGVYKSKAVLFVLVTETNAYLMRMDDLIAFLDKPTHGRRFIRAGDNYWSEGWLVPLIQLCRIDIPSLRTRLLI